VRGGGRAALARQVDFGEHADEFTDGVLRFHRMAQPLFRVESVGVATADLAHNKKTAVGEFPNNALCSSFGDTDRGRHVPDPRIRMSSDVDEHVAMVAENRPSDWF
jgi:hypothetical protein